MVNYVLAAIAALCLIAFVYLGLRDLGNFDDD
jgi:hypothetical protein